MGRPVFNSFHKLGPVLQHALRPCYLIPALAMLSGRRLVRELRAQHPLMSIKPFGDISSGWKKMQIQEPPNLGTPKVTGIVTVTAWGERASNRLARLSFHF